METKKILLIAVVITIFIAGFLIVYYYRDSILNRLQKQEGITQNQTIILEDKIITDTEKPFDITIKYPYVSGLDDFNKKSEEIINKELSAFKKISLENDQAIKEIDPESYEAYPREYYLNIEYDKGVINNEIISTVFNISNFTGGAHGANYFIALNYNIKNKKEIKLTDLFPEQPDYLQKISEFCTENLKQQIKERTGNDGGAWLDSGAGPNEENFSIFLINPSGEATEDPRQNRDKDTITFYFPQYQVAAYALGNFKVVMPR
jgi:hypothetical protein